MALPLGGVKEDFRIMFLRLYDFFKTHIALRWLTLCCVTAAMVTLVMRLSYKEDISDFLPLGTDDREALGIYQDISGASQLFIIFNNPGDEDKTIEAIRFFCDAVADNDTAGWTKGMTATIDMERITQVQEYVYANIPYFLTDADYARMDSLLAQPAYIERQLQADREMLLFPSGGLLSANIGRDPLNLFTPVLEKLQRQQHELRFESYDGYIFTPDMKKAIVMLPSPFGNAETERNAQLIALLERAITLTQNQFPGIQAHVAGGPAIAVGNAAQIKQDSVFAIALAAVLILGLLFYSFRSPKNILLIALSIGWGWLFALGGIALLHDSVSLIVIGISSIILGIAVNYPLHLVAHVRHQPDMRSALKEIFMPLLIGNITTVGAFLALVPLQSTALRDLGLFASLLLAGTILFVLVYLPHHVKVSAKVKEVRLLSRVSGIRLEDKRWAVACTLLLTALFAWFSLRTEFDANMANINYMSDQQREDMTYFQRLASPDSSLSAKTLYVVSAAGSIDEALRLSLSKQRQMDSLVARGTAVHEGVSQFLVPKAEQERRLRQWNDFLARHRQQLGKELDAAALRAGFTADAFEDFRAVLAARYAPRSFDYFKPLTDLVFAGNISINRSEGRYAIVDKLHVEETAMPGVKQLFAGSFDVESMNSALANSLSDNFNYIGWACSLIVFFFLWFSFGRIELALLAFIPMAVSWIWILGIMAILGVKFNIVNVILATFIFGQGDDYTIFMTEGCQYEYARRRALLASYKNSIILSALIMFIGIGTLIVARHPALHSLAEVTIIGMGSVVLMAWLMPPLIFHWLVKSRGRYRKRPLTIGALARTWFSGTVWIAQLAVGYILGFFLFVLTKGTERKRFFFHKFVTACHRLDMRLFPSVKFVTNNPHGEDFSKPCMIVCNHQSMLDPMCLMALSPRIIIMANQRSSLNPVVRLMFRWLEFYTIKFTEFPVTDKRDIAFTEDIALFRSLVERGYSIAIFVEGERNPESTVLRFHKGLFLVAEELGMDILPMYIHGLNTVMPIHSFASHASTVTLTVDARITHDSPLWAGDYSDTTRRVHQHYIQRYHELCRALETSRYFSQLVYERYLYKGTDIQSTVKRNLRRTHSYTDIVDRDYNGSEITVRCAGYGEDALLMALVHRDKKVVATLADEDRAEILRHSARGFVCNIAIKVADEV